MIKLDLAYGAGVWHRHEIRTFVMILVDYVCYYSITHPQRPIFSDRCVVEYQRNT